MTNIPERLAIYCKWFDNYITPADSIPLTLYKKASPTSDDQLNGIEFYGSLSNNLKVNSFTMDCRGIKRTNNSWKQSIVNTNYLYSLPEANSTNTETEGDLTKLKVLTYIPGY